MKTKFIMFTSFIAIATLVLINHRPSFKSKINKQQQHNKNSIAYKKVQTKKTKRSIASKLQKKIAKESLNEYDPRNLEALRVALNKYNENKQYPSNNFIIDPERSVDPLENRDKVRITPLSSNPDNDLQLIAWPDFNIFYQTDKITLFLKIQNAGQKTNASIFANLFNSKNELVQGVKYNNTGLGKYQASLNLTAGKYIIKIKAKTPEGEIAHAYTSFEVMTEHSNFLDKVKYKLTNDKDLEWNLFFDIYQTGQYLVQGVIYDEDNKPRAYAENVVQLNSGSRWIPLTFHGYLFYKNRINGPYKLKTLSLSKVTENLEIKVGQVFETNFQTIEYLSSELNSTPFSDRIMETKAKNLQAYLQTN